MAEGIRDELRVEEIIEEGFCLEELFRVKLAKVKSEKVRSKWKNLVSLAFD